MNLKACFLSVLAVLSATCCGDERDGRQQHDSPRQQHDILGIIPDEVLELDEETLDKIVADATRFNELDEIFTAALAERMNLPRGRWESFPEVFFFRVLLAQAALNGERTCEDRRRCAELDANAWPSNVARPQCSPEVCDQQRAETMSICNLILDQRCPRRPGVRGKCEELKREASATCTAIAGCQHGCCTQSCSGINCAAVVTGNTALDACANCGTNPDPGPAPG